MNSSYKRIVNISWPIIVSSLMQQALQVTDTAFVARLGETELGAVGMGGIYFLALLLLGFGFSMGTQIIIGQKNGAKKYSSIGQFFFSSASFLMVLALIVMVLSHIFSPIIMPYIISSKEVCKSTLIYLNWRVYGLFFSFAISLFRAFFVGITDTKVLTFNSIVMVLSNVFLNYILIFGKFGFPEMGVAGAAIASVFSEVISVVFYVIYMKYKIDLKKYGFKFPMKFNAKAFRKVFDLSIWVMFQPFLSVTVWFYFFAVVERLGERTLAIVFLIRSISAILFVIGHSLGATASTLASNLWGSHEKHLIPEMSKRVIKLSFVFLMPMLLVLAIFPYWILRILTDNQELITATYAALYVAIFAYILQIPGNVWFNIISGIGRTKVSLIITLITLLLYAISVYLIGTVWRMSAAWCWSTEIYYQIIIFVLCFIYLRITKPFGKKSKIFS